ncbi:MAG: histone-like protein [Pseudomonadota bacterium]
MAKAGSGKRRGAQAGVARKKRKNYTLFALYIYKVLKSISNDVGISKKGMNVINSLVQDMFEQIALEGSKLVRYHGKKTLSDNDIQSAVKLLLPHYLGTHALMEGNKAVAKYSNTR